MDHAISAGQEREARGSQVGQGWGWVEGMWKTPGVPAAKKKVKVCRFQLRRRLRAEVWIPWEVLGASKQKAGMGRERNRREKAFQNKVVIPRPLFEFITSY